MRKKIGSVIAGSAALAMCFMGVAAPAQAWNHRSPGSKPLPRPLARHGKAVSGGGGSVSRGIGKCHVVSSPNYLGVSCGSVTGGGTKTIKEILKGEPLPRCWDAPMTDAEKRALNLQDTPGYTWWWWKCLHGINPKTLKVEKGGIWISVGWDDVRDGKEIILKKHQKQLIEFKTGHGTIPTPVAAISPTGSPVVNEKVAFFDGTPHEVNVDQGGVSLRAKVTKLEVQPADDGTEATCPGSGVQVKRDDTKSSKPRACWYHFRHSSADQPDGRFSGSISAHWVVDYSTDGGHSWHLLNTFDKVGQTTQQVDEIQALNVA